MWVYACYATSKGNKAANKKSRKFRDNSEWLLKDKIFQTLIQKLGKVSID